MKSQGVHHASIAFLISTIVKALEKTAKVSMSQTNHIINSLKGCCAVVYPETMVRIILEIPIQTDIGNMKGIQLFYMFMFSRGGTDNHSGNVHTNQIVENLFFLFEIIFRIAQIKKIAFLGSIGLHILFQLCIIDISQRGENQRQCLPTSCFQVDS